MLIRSQNKKSIINLSNIDLINADNETIRAYNGNSSTTLGKYSTQEKAIKVLDQIQYSCITITNGSKYFSPVFQMPQDNEVQV